MQATGEMHTLPADLDQSPREDWASESSHGNKRAGRRARTHILAATAPDWLCLPWRLRDHWHYAAHFPGPVENFALALPSSLPSSRTLTVEASRFIVFQHVHTTP